MTKKPYPILFCSVFLLWALACSGLLPQARAAAEEGAALAADNQGPSATPAESRLLELVNQARQNPLAAAASLGLEPAQVLADNPDIAGALKNGMPPLAWNKTLYVLASGHARDMLENNYYAYTSINGETPLDRVAESGYTPVSGGEALGLLFFRNYMDPQKAAARMFENMLREELSPERTAGRSILHPGVRQAGIAVQGGTFALSEASANAYMAVCDVARPVRIWELQLMNLISQLRADPQAVIAEYGIAAGPADFPELEPLFAEGLPPLALNSDLYMAADDLVADMLEHGHCSGETADGIALGERLRANGYTPSWAGEARLRLPTCEPQSPAKTVHWMFRNLLARAFCADPQKRNQSMLAAEAADAGIRVKAGKSAVLGGICGDDVHLLVADFAAPCKEEENPPAEGDELHTSGKAGYLVGLVFADLDGNGIYNAGEGASEARVIVDKGPETEILHETRVNAAGGYCFALPPGQYRVRVEASEQRFVQRVHMENGVNTWIPTVVAQPGRETGM